MATFTEIYYNGNEYNQIWLNGTKVWEKDSGGGEIVYPYPDVDCVITYKARSGTYPSKYTFKIIDDTLPYSINGEAINETYLYYGEKTKLINLKPYVASGSDNVINIEQLRIPNLTDLSYLFAYYYYDNSTDIFSWQPQYFEFHPNPTNMANMLGGNWNLTDEMMNQFMPYFPNTSNVTTMEYMFYDCVSLTALDLSNFNTSQVTYMYGMFHGCSSLQSLNLSSFDTRKVTDCAGMFQYVSNCTIYIGENWTLGTESTFGGGSNLTFIRVVPITTITLESTLTDTTITKGTQFTITPTITPTDYSGDELVITYDENYLSMVDNTFTVLDTATIGQQLDITYSSKNNPSVSATYSVSIRDIVPITSITLTHTLEALVDVAIGTTFTVVPTVEPTSHDDVLLVVYDTNYLSKD